MITNFFKQMDSLNLTGNVQLTLSKGAANNLIVSVMLHNEPCGDTAKQLIPPFNLRGTAEELDEGFFERITAPLQTASGLMDNMEAFMKQLATAKQQSAMEKEKAEKVKKDKEAKEKKYKEAMQKVEELEKAGKYSEAWVKVPEPSDYPEKAEELRKRKSALSAKFSTQNLFGATPPKAASEPQTTCLEDEEGTEEYGADDESTWNDNDEETD
jgi:PRTRC genetic system protein E